jgi:hypothetical protein
MRKFPSQTPINAPAVIDFGAASDQVARVLDPGVYALRIESARVIQKNENTLIVLDLVEVEKGRVALQPIWIDGPNVKSGGLAAENRHLIAQLLTLAGQPTQGNVGDLIPKLARLSFEARLVLSTDGRTGRIYNALAEIFPDGGA